MEDINYKSRIEAILFTTGRFMDIEEIARLCDIGSAGIVKGLMEELMKDYEKSSGALALFFENGKYKLGIRKEYNYLTTNLMNNSELDEPTMKTLALLAYKQPVLQSEIIAMRGNTAYDHIKVLKEVSFIVAEKKGRTRLLKLAPKFFDYFDLVESEVRSKIASEAAKKVEGETNLMEAGLEKTKEEQKRDADENKSV